MTSVSLRSQALAAAGIGLGLFLGWLALRRMDWPALLDVLEAVDLRWIFPFLASLAGFCWFKSARWGVLLSPHRRPQTRRLMPAVVVGYAATTLMPMQMGEVVRAYVASRTLAIRMAAALASIAVERLLDVIVLASVLGIVVFSGARMSSGLGQAGVWMTAIAVGALALAAVGLRFPQLVRRSVDVVLRRLPARAAVSLRDQMAAAATGLQAVSAPAAYSRIILFSALQWTCMLGCAWLSLRAVGLDLPPTAAMAVLATTLIGMSLPAGPGYVGTIQFAFVVALTPFGVSKEAAVAASLFYHVFLCAPLLLWGMGYAASLRLTWADLRSRD